MPYDKVRAGIHPYDKIVELLLDDLIQCKWQASAGTVDEKFPFEVLSINADRYPAILVLDGNGYSQGAEQSIRGQAGKNRLRHVMNLGDFQRFVSRGEL